jgi:ketosteroid isomerase-like protein
MSQENVEIVRSVYDAFRRGAWDEGARLVDPDAELLGTVGGLSEGSVARGVQEGRQAFEQWDEDWDESRLEPEAFIDAGDRVVVLQHEVRRGRGSGVEVESHTGVVFELRDGLVVRVQGFMDQAEALEAVGLRK